MDSIKQITIGMLVGFLPFCAEAMAQTGKEAVAADISAARDEWRQRVLRRGRTNHAKANRTASRSTDREAPVRTVSTRIDSAPGHVAAKTVFDPTTTDVRTVQHSTDITYGTAGPELLDAEIAGPVSTSCGYCGDSLGGCDDCGDCGGVLCHDCYDGCWLGLHGLRSAWWTRDMSFFAGVHGFKGPADQGRNGNFGLHEGVNWGSALGGPWGIGYQVGIAAAHSNFSGDRVAGIRSADRDQIFFTAGLFRRALCGGWQSGVAFDILYDSYYDQGQLKQIRSETSYRFAGGMREVGYFGAYGTGGDEFILIDRTTIGLEPTDMFAFYYRRYFRDGGDGRFWGGFTGAGDALIGAEIRVPIGNSWAMENRVNYLIPKQGSGAGGGQAEESWGLSFNLVWYVGQSSRSVDQSPYRPMFNVADNATVMSDIF